MARPITSHDFSEIRWRGHWIWLAEEAVQPSGFWSAERPLHPSPSHGLFQKHFHLDALPERVPARITADSRYALFVNGQLIGRGPIRTQPRRLGYDLYDLAPYLQAGENVIAAYVVYYGEPTSFWMPAAPNNTLGTTGVLVFEADLGAGNWLASDESWLGRKASAWSDNGFAGVDHGEGVPVEVFDARLLEASWATSADAMWQPVQTVAAKHIGGFARSQPPTDPYGPLYPRPIAQLGGERKQPRIIRQELIDGQVALEAGGPIARVQASLSLPIAATTHVETLPLTCELPIDSSIRLVFDLGGIVSGLTTLVVDAPAGAVFDFSYAEEPLAPEISMDKMRAGMRYIARAGFQRFQAFESNGFRYAYLLISGSPAPITIHEVAVQEQLYPWQGQASFVCDDDELNRIYAASMRTVQLCSHDAFIDCPTREQRAWVGDAVVHQMVSLATNTDWRLAWHYLTLSNSPRADGILPMTVVSNIEASGGYSLPDWSLHWIHGLYNCYRFGGDRELVASFMPTAARILRWYAPYQTASGVLQDVPEWNLVDWSSVSTEDTSAVLTALWARGLREFAELAAWLEERTSQHWAEAHYEQARAGFEMFWDAARGSYVDHIVDQQQRPEMSQLAGALAIVSGLAPTARWPQIIAAITNAERLVVRSWTGNGAGEQSMEKWQQQVREGRYTIDWDAEREIVLAQPFMSYVVHDAVVAAGRADLLPDLYRRWSQFLVDGYDTIGECWDFGTHAHGWSCTPARDMVFYTLGVTPAAPGYAKARVAPRLGVLRWAKGAVPTPHGLIRVEISAEGVTIDSPVPVLLEREGHTPRELAAGYHHVS